MDDDVRKLLEENRNLILENRTIIQDNQKGIKKIQSHIRRTMVAKTIYWLVIIGVTVSALYFSKPYIKDAIEKYDDVKKGISTSSEIINDPGGWFKDVNLIERIFGSESSE